MDTFLNKIDRLADLASRETDPQPIDADAVMARIAALPRAADDEEPETFSLRLFAGVGAAAAAAALVVFVLAAGAWTDINSPAAAIESLMEVMESSL